MTPAATSGQRLAALYPPAVRRRWGPELAREIDNRGPGGWTNTLLVAANLWLHPADWPTSDPRESRRLLTCAAVSIVGAGGLVLRAQGSASGAPGWAAAIGVLLGAALLLPIPTSESVTATKLGDLTITGLRLLVPLLPCSLIFAVILWRGAPENSRVGVNLAMLALYWTTLAGVVVQGCRFFAHWTAAVASRPPGVRRLRAALALTTVSLAGCSLDSVATRATPTGLTEAALLAAVAVLLGQQLRDSGRLRTTPDDSGRLTSVK